MADNLASEVNMRVSALILNAVVQSKYLLNRKSCLFMKYQGLQLDSS